MSGISSGKVPSPEALALLDEAPCGLLRTADDGLIQRTNRTFREWLGRSAEDLMHARFQSLLTVGSRIFHQTHWTPLLQMQGSVSEVKLGLLHADGSTVPMMLNAIRRADGDGFAHDIAAYVARDRDRFEQEVVRSRQRLEQAVAVATKLEAAAKSRALFAEQMIGIVSHDLRTPLSTIMMATTLLGHGDAVANKGRVIERITRATDRAQRLITDLLDFTQTRFGKGLSLVRSPCDLHRIVADGVEDLRLAHPSTTLLHRQQGEGVCEADAGRLEQLLGNLVSNAAAYGEPQAPITVISSIGDVSFALSVHNHGVPIPAAIQSALFEPMTRGTTKNSKARSVGLGLFIVREIARAHGGEAKVHSTLEDGTTFEIVLPRVAPQHGRSSAPA